MSVQAGVACAVPHVAVQKSVLHCLCETSETLLWNDIKYNKFLIPSYKILGFFLYNFICLSLELE